MKLNTFKGRVAAVEPGKINHPEEQEVLIRIQRGGRKKPHYAKVLHVMDGSLGIGDGKHYTEISCEYMS